MKSPHRLPFSLLFGERNKKTRRSSGATARERRRRLRSLVSRTSQTKELQFSPARIVLFCATATLLSLLLCIHLWPNRVSFRLGDIADREIVAQRTARYEDTESTRQLREDAASHVEKQYEVIPDATTTALDGIRSTFDTLDRDARLHQAGGDLPAEVTAAPGASPATTAQPAAAFARKVAADIRRQASVFVPAPDIELLLKQDSATREMARTAAMALAEHAMTKSIDDDNDDLITAKRFMQNDPALLTVPAGLRETVKRIAGAVLTPTRRFDSRETGRRRQAAQTGVPPQMNRILAGAAIVRSGERVTQRHLDAFAALGLQNARLDALTVIVISTMVWLLVTLVAVYLRLFHRELYDDTPRLALLALLSVVSVVGLKIGSTLLGLPISGVHFGYLGMMCVASAGMVIALLLSPRVASVVVALLSVASGLILNNELRFTVITLASSLVGIVSVTSLKNRGDLLRATLILCGSNAVINLLVGELQGDLPAELATGVLWGVISGLFALVLFWLGVAVFEKPFGITTHLRLLELSDPATPILQEFRMRVPGTYAHSLMVGNLAHAAAEAIGADSLLVRVAAYYHDLGKMNRPEFYIENQSNAENIHDRISPSLSALILASHVKEGLDLAEEVGLPPRVREVIQQHHGTSLMKYFYHQASGGLYDTTLEAQFRYPGPKPQTKEAAILMLADGVEAASRTLERPTPSRIADFIARMVEDKRADGQLDECDLTLRDLRSIQEVFTRTLSGTLHARIEYPEDRKHLRPAATAAVLPPNIALPALSLQTFESEAQGALTPLTIVHSAGSGVAAASAGGGDREERRNNEKQHDGANGSDSGRTRRPAVGAGSDSGGSAAKRGR